jgi:2-polyprenyl-3-methyl-5-hydroxy-6-metoxy-1,4-benzoquinol methylase
MKIVQALPRVPILRGRQDVVVERSRGKRVLHLGCVDAGLTSERLAEGGLLHGRLREVAAELWGIDSDAPGIELLRRHGFEKLLVADVRALSAEPALAGRRFDLVLAPEVLEHVDNSGLFLAHVHALLAAQGELLVSVPNAFRLETLLGLLRGQERVHPDHIYWFSYHTVTNLLRRAGFTPTEVFAYSFEDASLRPGLRWARLKTLPRRLLVRWLYSRTPFFADGIVVVARPRSNGV